MPITDRIRTSDGQIYCWHTDESVEELTALCEKNNLATFKDIGLEPRRKQQMVTLLLHHELFPGAQLRYEPTGKPFIPEGPEVSISHSGEIVVMMRSNVACGVDVERIHPRVRKVRHKFLSDSELLITQDASDILLTQFWTAKEAMFKVSGSDRVFMRSNIFVDELSDQQATAVLVDGDHQIQRAIKFHYFNDLILAWTETHDEA